MPRFRTRFLLALVLSLLLHAGLLKPWTVNVPTASPQHLQVRIEDAPERETRHIAPANRPTHFSKETSVADTLSQPPTLESAPASMPAPPAPTSEEWKLAAAYTPRNSKRYRHTWGQQVRSMMGTAVEGPDQGLVRFRIEIAPDGKITKIEELWSTSKAASKLAWKAIHTLPRLPPTPSGKPLVFEQTLSFLPYETGWPPSYQLDCLPEPGSFKNPYVWDGASPPGVATREHRPPPPEGCPPDATEETIEDEERSFKRQMDQWRWGR